VAVKCLKNTTKHTHTKDDYNWHTFTSVPCLPFQKHVLPLESPLTIVKFLKMELQKNWDFQKRQWTNSVIARANTSVSCACVFRGSVSLWMAWPDLQLQMRMQSMPPVTITLSGSYMAMDKILPVPKQIVTSSSQKWLNKSAHLQLCPEAVNWWHRTQRYQTTPRTLPLSQPTKTIVTYASQLS
jgi:hypothetical protein